MFYGMHGRGFGAGGRDWERFAAKLASQFAGAQRAGAQQGGGGRRQRMFDGGELRLVMLKLIADEPRHGYDLIREIETMTGGAYAPSPGVVYPTLTLLDEMGLIEEHQSEGAKKRFAATADGRTHLAERQAEVDMLIARLEELGAHRRKAGGGAPIGRAMGNLGQAIAGRLARGDFSEDTLHDAAALIDEVAQKIERLR